MNERRKVCFLFLLIFHSEKKDGSLTSISAAIDSAGSSYQLPTASANTKGGVKIGNSLEMNGETLDAKSQLPAHTSTEAGKVLTVGDDGSLEWDENGGAGVEILTQAEWDALTTAEKQAKGLVIIQTAATGFILGKYVDGSEYALFRVENVNVGEGSYSATIEGDTITFSFTDVPNIGGAIISTDDNTVTGVGIRVPDLTVQMGTCTKAAVLPTVITQGLGRNEWYSGGVHSFSFNPSAQNAFFGVTGTEGTTYTYTAYVTLTRT